MSDIRFAVVSDGMVVNVIVAPDDFEIEGVELVPSDVAEIGDLYENGEFSPPDPTPEILPDLTMRQFRLGLLGAGLLDDVTAAIEGMQEPAKSAAMIEFEYASVVVRTDPLVSTLAAGLNLTDEQIDALWRSAGAL